MKSLQITLMLAVFCLTISGTSNTSETKLNFNEAQIEAYKKLNKESKLTADLNKKGQKPNQNML